MPIQKLADHVINQIAAGEVVERPASVVKELVENSLDAGATLIEVRIEQGGKGLIEVTDNGSGVDESDFPLLFERHATSKITSIADLERAQTMGFRGEALASIGSVAKVTVQSRRSGTDMAWRMVKIGRQTTDLEPVAMSSGTILRVEELFTGIPARQKYLKADNTEYRHIAQVLMDIAAANPELQLRLYADGKLRIDYLPGDLLSRTREILGADSSEQLVPISYQSQDLQIEGFMMKPQYAVKNRDKQFVSVNSRPLQLPFVGHAIKQALHTLIPHNLFPIFLLRIQIDPAAVDINVHPRKEEARFAYQQFVYQKVLAAAKASLEKHVLTAQLEFGTPSVVMPISSTPGARSVSPNSGSGYLSPIQSSAIRDHRPQPTVHQGLAFNEGFSGGQLPHQLRQEPSVQPLAQIDTAYIVGVNQKGLVVIDQHAAHERIRYAQLQKERRLGQERVAQKLITPLELNLSPAEASILDDYLAAIEAVGFEVRLDGLRAIFAAVPAVLKSADDLMAVVRGLVADLQNTPAGNPQLLDLETRIERVINYTACRSAIKFGQALTLEEMRALIVQLDEAETNYTCPHGRPTRMELGFGELEKRFGR